MASPGCLIRIPSRKKVRALLDLKSKTVYPRVKVEANVALAPDVAANREEAD